MTSETSERDDNATPPPELDINDMDWLGYETAAAQAKREREHFEQVILPARVKDAERRASELLPDGYEFKFGDA